ncbi:MAG: T9SS type A sorting domain-containing protein [Bacteroidia bacterium]
MKRIFTLFSATLALLAADAQQKNFNDLLKVDNTPGQASRAAGSLADSSMTYQWNGTAWDALAKKVFTFDVQGRISILNEYDPVSGKLEHQSNYTYHTNGLVSLIVVKANNDTAMVPFERHRYNFDAENNRTSYRKDIYYLQQWVEDSGDSIQYEYDANKRILSYTLLQMSSGVLYYFQKLIWSDFNPLNFPQTLTVQAYQGGFENYIRLSNMTWGVGYDAFHFMPTSYVGSTWNGTWNPVVYDSSLVADGKIQKSYQFSYDGMNIIDTSLRTEYVYDPMGHRMQTVSYQYAGNAWSISSGDRDSIEYGIYDEVKKQTLSFYSNSSQNWEYLNEERFYYHGLSIGDLTKQNLVVFPNPASSWVILNVEMPLAEVRLMDLQGKSYTLPVENNRVDIRQLPEGIYILQVTRQGEYLTGKLAICH